MDEKYMHNKAFTKYWSTESGSKLIAAIKIMTIISFYFGSRGTKPSFYTRLTWTYSISITKWYLCNNNAVKLMLANPVPTDRRSCEVHRLLL